MVSFKMNDMQCIQYHQMHHNLSYNCLTYTFDVLPDPLASRHFNEVSEAYVNVAIMAQICIHTHTHPHTHGMKQLIKKSHEVIIIGTLL